MTPSATEIAKRSPQKPGLDLRDPGLAICLSGGGYRALLFHLGALRRLNEVGLLKAASRISSVSGGSIVAAALAIRWDELRFDDAGRAVNFDIVEDSAFSLAAKTLDWRCAAVGVLPGTTGAARLARVLADALGETTLADLPEGSPRFTFNTTNMQTGNLIRWSREYAADYAIGRIERPAVPVATIVAASAAFPPWLSPLRLRDAGQWLSHADGSAVADPPRTLWLTDGGVYDNLGIETAKSFTTVLVSDAGAAFDAGRRIRSGILSQSLRTAFLLNDHVGRLRRRQLVTELTSGMRRGAIWPIGTPLSAYPASRVLECPRDRVSELASTPTRLRRLPESYRYRLANWGYAATDAALHSYVDPDLPQPADFPYPGGV